MKVQIFQAESCVESIHRVYTGNSSPLGRVYKGDISPFGSFYTGNISPLGKLSI